MPITLPNREFNAAASVADQSTTLELEKLIELANRARFFDWWNSANDWEPFETRLKSAQLDHHDGDHLLAMVVVFSSRLAVPQSA